MIKVGAVVGETEGANDATVGLTVTATKVHPIQRLVMHSVFTWGEIESVQ